MSQRLRIAAAFLTLMLQGVAGVAYPAGVVLCVADDGHVSVETVHEIVRCTADWERHHPNTPAASDVGAHPCTDTFLSQPAARSVQVPAVGMHAMALPAGLAVVAPAPSAVPRSARSVPPRGRLASLRSVVLQA